MEVHDVNTPGLCAARLSPAELAAHFDEAHPPLTPSQAQIEAERCYYCHDAPCTTACPTGIDIPSFIARIGQGNLRGAAQAILEANPLGGMCARVCPTEVLCEQACVRNTQQTQPVEIGLLQRHATDALMTQPQPPLFTRAPATGRRVAVVGAGPAGLACAHGLARRGHDVTLLDARPKPGGLNEYGLATYKTPGDFAQREIDWLMSIGGITWRAGQTLGQDMSLADLLRDHDAVFLGLGLAGVNALALAGTDSLPGLPGFRDAVDFIADLRQAPDKTKLAVGRQVVVIGGGMTAVDAAVQAKLLGAREVTLVYRRGPQHLSASAHEQDWARQNGVTLRCWLAPQRLVVDNSGSGPDGPHLTGLDCVRTELVDGQLRHSDETIHLPADMVLRAIGQQADFPALQVSGDAGRIALKDGRIVTDDSGRTGLARVWAGGDCRHGGRDLTVEAVEHGKRAALDIDAHLRGTSLTNAAMAAQASA
ncbi:NAD(P)-dependent oxidoreductase [Amphibiibacter pelophylacis]|uniref:NAD(P)-dependent oxidoreductase n=1 Tax=Amphibiibacter pelophylacis TaxID=1799477 RepID=A0ACC6P3U1_9BURK